MPEGSGECAGMPDHSPNDGSMQQVHSCPALIEGCYWSDRPCTAMMSSSSWADSLTKGHQNNGNVLFFVSDSLLLCLLYH